MNDRLATEQPAVEPQREKPSTPRSSFLSDLLSCFVLFGGVVTGIITGKMIISTYSALPHWDEWELVDRLATGKPWSLAWFWMQHNEHRIPFTKLLFLIDARFFHGSQVLLLASTFVALVFQAVLLSWALWSLGGVRGAAWRTGTGLIAFCILCPIQQENLVWGFQFTFVLPAVMATLATFSLLEVHRNAGEGSRRRELLFLSSSIAAGSVATFSLANGMLLWPVLVLAAVLLRLKHTATVALLIAATVNTAAYLYGYQLPLQHPRPSFSIHGFIEIGRYVALYFGSTWIHHAAGPAPVTIGLVALGVALAFAGTVLLRCRRQPLFLVQLSLIIIFCVGTAIVTAVGRARLGLEQATASRYQVFALLFWGALGLALLFSTASDGRTRRQLVLFSGFTLLLMLASATQVRYPINDAKWHQIRLQSISLALLTDVQDSEQLALAFPDPTLVMRDAGYLERNRLSIFRGRLYSQLGQPLQSLYRDQSSEECSGYIASSQLFSAAASRGLRVTGYAWNRVRGVPITEVIFKSEDGRIRGFASTVTIPMHSVKPGPTADAKRFGWMGYAGELPDHGKVEAYGVLEKRLVSVCRFAEVSF